MKTAQASFILWASVLYFQLTGRAGTYLSLICVWQVEQESYRFFRFHIFPNLSSSLASFSTCALVITLFILFFLLERPVRNSNSLAFQVMRAVIQEFYFTVSNKTMASFLTSTENGRMKSWFFCISVPRPCWSDIIYEVDTMSATTSWTPPEKQISISSYCFA